MELDGIAWNRTEKFKMDKTYSKTQTPKRQKINGKQNV